MIRGNATRRVRAAAAHERREVPPLAHGVFGRAHGSSRRISLCRKEATSVMRKEPAGLRISRQNRRRHLAPLVEVVSGPAPSFVCLSPRQQIGPEGMHSSFLHWSLGARKMVFRVRDRVPIVVRVGCGSAQLCPPKGHGSCGNCVERFAREATPDGRQADLSAVWKPGHASRGACSRRYERLLQPLWTDRG
jgi:hypothetical protein